MQQIPSEIIGKIFEYDDTFRKVYDTCMNELLMEPLRRIMKGCHHITAIDFVKDYDEALYEDDYAVIVCTQSTVPCKSLLAVAASLGCGVYRSNTMTCYIIKRKDIFVYSRYPHPTDVDDPDVVYVVSPEDMLECVCGYDTDDERLSLPLDKDVVVWSTEDLEMLVYQ